MKMSLYKTQLYLLKHAWKLWHVKSRSFFENLWVKLKFADSEYSAKLPTCLPCCNPHAKRSKWQRRVCEALENMKYDVDAIIYRIESNPDYKVTIDQRLWWVKPFIRARR